MLDWLTSLAGTGAYVMVAVMAALETSAFAGLLVPGELALLAGGYVSHLGKARPEVMMAVAAGGAVVGDLVGYEVGRRFGPGLRRSRMGQRVGEDRWQRAEEFVASKGGRAVFAGRFIGVLRALVPAIAGMTRMPYRRFLVCDVAGAVLWAPGLVLAGYAVGPSYRRVAHVAGPAGLVLLGVLLAVVGVVWSGRWMARHPDQVRAFAQRYLERRWVVSVGRRYRTQLGFLADRLRPGNALGLALTAELAVLAAAGWVFGVFFQDVVTGEAARIDLPVTRYLAQHRTEWLTGLMRALTWIGSTVVLLPLVAIVGLAARRRKGGWAVLATLTLSLAGAVALYDVVKPIVARPRPAVGQLIDTATGYSFPSGHATQTVAVCVTLALLVSATVPWPRKVAAWTAAVLASLLVGFSRVYLGVHWPTDVFAGYALGLAWAALSFAAIRWYGTIRASRPALDARPEEPYTASDVPSEPEVSQ